MKDKKKQYLNTDDIDFLIIHCSDTTDKEDLNALEIHRMHLNFGWEGVGYHKIIKRSGDVENGRPEFWVGAHTKGLNDKSLGVCLIGRNKFTEKQFDALEKILKNWKKKYPKAKILGHKDAIQTDKTCPNFNVFHWCKNRGFYE